MIFKRSKQTKNTIANADKIVENYLYVHSAWPAVNVTEITWEENPYQNVTWCFYLHSLDIVAYLMHAYELDSDLKYLKKAKEIIHSWIVKNPSKEQQASVYAWKDHSVANRIVNIIHFWDNYKDSPIYEETFTEVITQTLIKHGNYLEDDKNHTFINNHGIFQDRSLIELSLVFPHLANADRWYDKAINRFMDHARKDVAQSGVHLEHSAEYHIVVLNLFRSINDFLNYHGKEVPELSFLIYKMEEYLAYLFKPDGKIPLTGDSNPLDMSHFSEKMISNPNFLFIFSSGLLGKQPEIDKVYKDAGVAIFRNNWTFNSAQLYLKFTAGFHSRVHKHADDLSILLSIGQTDFFVDSGKYNYQEKDSYRQYFRSTKAHNTVTVNRKSYEITDEQIGKSNIQNYGFHQDYSFVTGIHSLYPGNIVKRTLLYLKKMESIIIFDELTSNKECTYSQIFNIGEHVNTTVETKKKIILESTLDGRTIELLQMNHVTEFKRYEGHTQPIGGWQSSVFNKKHPITQIQFSNKGNGLEYKTIINTHKDIGIKYFSTKKVDDQKTIYSITDKYNEKLYIKI
ncbi:MULTISPECIES: alginate lyase family protein [Bacillus]|uniref:alginate lyase family protein n=1 Tax=Bacillus TaxID=1386 RepID=UPI000696FE12|nr:alginate lyase family protein [Bacillus altitudinis]MBU8651402.1 heparinase II/III family protein [Bacillus altitudinis]MBU8777358.1 heparinase II/III family protein [Bacillus altitudinis]MCY7711606.1 heparinase II/III family protein [Bacillus altitudinis]MED0681807.1 alginate lyase family protein [Bacillus altitudinis]WHY04948.1 alginate lyase family protein [Bacillus altitudinis]